ncbi:MAG: hypothetical protein WBN45_15330 [Arenicellales bacterium]|jgi:hypothetical protein
MKNIIKVFVLMSILVSTSGYGSATIGLGWVSCSSWTNNRSRDTLKSAQFESWVLGFLTGAIAYGTWDKDLLNGNSVVDVIGWVDTYCRTNPLNDITDASTALVGVLKG